MSTLQQTLGISAISIVLLFAAMAIIWGLMALMARIPDRKNEVPQPVVVARTAEEPVATILPQETKADKVKAAAAAVAAALAIRRASVRFAPKVSSAASTPWQAAQRANHISRRNQIISRR